MMLTGSLARSDKEKIRIKAWPDADLNGCYLTTKSTSGFFMELVGEDGRGFPLSWGSKRQGGTAQHTAEAETVSLANCLRSEAIPMQYLLQQFALLLNTMLNTEVKMIFRILLFILLR